MPQELLDGRRLPALDYPANEGQERNRPAQMDADFKVLYILLHINML